MAISKYTTELGDEIALQISTSSKSLKKICIELDVPYRTVCNWIYDTAHPMWQKYARAKELQADYLADEILSISDDSSNDTIQGEYGPIPDSEWINRSKLRVDSRKWLAGKLNKKKYGDKVDVTSGDEKIPAPIGYLTATDLNALLELQAKAGV